LRLIKKERTSSGEIDSGALIGNCSRNFESRDSYERVVFFLGVQPMVFQVKIDRLGYFHGPPPDGFFSSMVLISRSYQILWKILISFWAGKIARQCKVSGQNFMPCDKVFEVTQRYGISKSLAF
jgi:hypothetical protein